MADCFLKSIVKLVRDGDIENPAQTTAAEIVGKFPGMELTSHFHSQWKSFVFHHKVFYSALGAREDLIVYLQDHHCFKSAEEAAKRIKDDMKGDATEDEMLQWFNEPLPKALAETM